MEPRRSSGVAVGLAVLIGLSGNSAVGQASKAQSKVVVDSQMSLSQALAGTKAPKAHRERLTLVTVHYKGFDGRRHRGQIVVDKGLANEVKEIFSELEKIEYPIKKVIPISRYGWHDQKSINDNNTSAFNYRKAIGPGTSGTSLSHHSYGRAIDLNPYFNPFVAASGKSPRPYNTKHKATLTPDSAAVRAFRKRGWKWGGDWDGGKDYQHFEKPPFS